MPLVVSAQEAAAADEEGEEEIQEVKRGPRRSGCYKD